MVRPLITPYELGVLQQGEWGSSLEIVSPAKQHWLADPASWAQERAGLELWSKQREIMQAMVDHPRVAVRSCHTVGKTFTGAAVAAWWIDVHPPGSAFVITTAPTATQVKALLWREINRLHAKIGLPGRVNLTEWYLGQEMVALGRKPSEYNESSFQGIHALYVLAVLDEACGIPETLWTAAETMTSNQHSKILAIGNPDLRDSEFARVFDQANWHGIQIGYLDTPNFNNDPVSQELRDLLISPGWVEDRRAKWGEGSALYQSKVLGEFPGREHDPWKVIPYAWAQAARYADVSEVIDGTPEAGIDVGAGGDQTVIRERRGDHAGRREAFRDSDPMATVGKLAHTLGEWGIERVKIDVIGVGWGVYGRLRELRGQTHKAQVIPVNFGARSSNQRRFANLRAEVWWEIGREYSRTRRWDLSEVDDDVIAELTEPKYEIMDSYGKIKIEAKDEIRARLGRSPDDADALLLAFYEGAHGGPVNTDAVEVFRQSSLVRAGTTPASPFGSFREQPHGAPLPDGVQQR